MQHIPKKASRADMPSKLGSICHITSAHPADDIRIFHKECTTLADGGYEVHLVAGGTLPMATHGVIHHSLPVSSRWGRVGRILFRSWFAYRLAKATKATVFHIHDPELLPYGLLLKWQGYRVIYDAHEDLPRDVMMKDWIPKRCRRYIAWLVERIENTIAVRLDCVITATPYIARRFNAVGAHAIAIRNFPKQDELQSNPSSVSSCDARHAVCYVGLMSIPRGIIEMIEATLSLDVQLILAGAFVDEKTEQRARALPGWSKVDFRGKVSREGIAEIFSQSMAGMCVLHPTSTYIESMPIKLFEYMSAGLPVIASNFAPWRAIVSETNSGFCVDPLDITGIKAAIQTLLSHPSEARAMGLRGRLAVETCYNWESEGIQLLEAYLQIMS